MCMYECLYHNIAFIYTRLLQILLHYAYIDAALGFRRASNWREGGRVGGGLVSGGTGLGGDGRGGESTGLEHA